MDCGHAVSKGTGDTAAAQAVHSGKRDRMKLALVPHMSASMPAVRAPG